MSENIVGPGSSYGGASVVTYTGSPPAIDDVVVFADTSGLRIKDSATKLSAKLNVSGSLPMEGDLDLAHNDIKNSGDIHPRDDNDADLGTPLKRFKTIHYVTLDPAPPPDATKLPLAGGTMAGTLAMGAHDITGVARLSGATHNFAADDIVSLYPLAVATDGQLTQWHNGGVGAGLENSGILAADVVYNAFPGPVLDGSLCQFAGAGARWITTSGVLISDYLPKAGGTMTGTLAMGTHDLLNVGALAGATASRAVDDIVSVSGGSAAGGLPMFGVGPVIVDTGVFYGDVVQNVGPGVADGRIIAFSGTTGRSVADGGVLAANVAYNSGGAVTSGHVAQFSGTGGRQLVSAGAPLSAYLPIAGGVMTGGLLVRSNEPVSCAKWVHRGNSAVLTTSAAEVSFFGATSSGSRTFAAGTVPGLTVRFTGYAFFAGLGAAETFTLRLKNTTGTLITHTFSPGVIANAEARFEVVTTFTSGTSAQCNSEIRVNGIAIPSIFGTGGVWDSTIAQTLDVTMQFGSASANNTIQTGMAFFETIYET